MGQKAAGEEVEAMEEAAFMGAEDAKYPEGICASDDGANTKSNFLNGTDMTTKLRELEGKDLKRTGDKKLLVATTLESCQKTKKSERCNYQTRL